MKTPKTICPECGVEFLQSTADATGGLCRKCKTPKLNMAVENAAETVSLGARILRGIGVGVVFSALGFALGSSIWTGVGIILALVLAPIGTLYGIFLREINFILSMFARSIFDNNE